MSLLCSPVVAASFPPDELWRPRAPEKETKNSPISEFPHTDAGDLSDARVHHAVGCPAHGAHHQLTLGIVSVARLHDPGDLSRRESLIEK